MTTIESRGHTEEHIPPTNRYNKTFLKTTIDKDGNITVHGNMWDREPRAPITRIAKPEPREPEAILVDVEATGNKLQEEIDLYRETAGTNPHQQEILDIKLKLAELQPIVRQLEQRLIELQQAPTPTDRYFAAIGDATQKTATLAHEATERAIRVMAKQQFDIENIAALSKDNLKQIKATSTLAKIKDLTLPFFHRNWSDAQNKEQHAQSAIDKCFDGLARLFDFLA